jgi:iron complex transport system permease protein
MLTIRCGLGWLLLGLAFVAVSVASLGVGPAELSLTAVWAALRGLGDPLAQSVVLGLRLPRWLAACGVGSSLAVAGVLLQALFRNPLADPYVLGVSGGAAVGGLLALLGGASVAGGQLGAAGGALLATLTVILLARGTDSLRLLLSGVVVAAACGAVVTLLLVIASDDQLRGMIFWLAGDLSLASAPWASLALALAGGLLATLFAMPLDVLAGGELRARTLGLDVARWRRVIVVAAILLTSVAVTTAGTIGFVGLVTPHLVRLLFGTSAHRIVAPAAALAGATLVAAADLLARTVAAPRELPVGAVMALIGAPLFALLLRRGAAPANR